MSGHAGEPLSLLFAADDEVPNNARLAVLHYQGVLACAASGRGDAARLADEFEALFARNHWPPAWRNGIFGFHHFHSNAHEVLGICSGVVTVRLGGDTGRDVVLQPGDVVVLPAGIAHKQVRCSGDLQVVGAYPEGQNPDACRADASQLAARTAAVEAVPMPLADPVLGMDGPLLRRWSGG